MQNTVSVLSLLRARELGRVFYTQLDEVFWMGKREYEFSGTNMLTMDNVAFERQPSNRDADADGWKSTGEEWKVPGIKEAADSICHITIQVN